MRHDVTKQILELFEVPPDGVVTRKEFVDRIVDIFVQRRSLQLTLADYEVGVSHQTHEKHFVARGVQHDNF